MVGTQDHPFRRFGTISRTDDARALICFPNGCTLSGLTMPEPDHGPTASGTAVSKGRPHLTPLELKRLDFATKELRSLINLLRLSQD